MNTKTGTEIVLALGPPVIATCCLSFSGLVGGYGWSHGDWYQAFFFSGVSGVCGFVFGTLGWSEVLRSPQGRFFGSVSRVYGSDARSFLSPTENHSIELHIREEHGGGVQEDWDRYDLPKGVTLGQLVEMAKITHGANWEFKGSMFYPRSLGRPFSRPEYEALVLLLEKQPNNMLEAKSKASNNVGIRVTPLGRHFFTRLAASPTPEKVASLRLVRRNVANTHTGA